MEAKIESDSSHPSISSLRKILQMTAETSEEKFKILDARDKLYKIMKEKDSSLKRGPFLATCHDMCPEKERLLREHQNRGSIFEMTNFSRNLGFDHNLAVKEYARSSADQEEPLPHELRPIKVLSMTMSHLLHNVVDFCELSDDNLEEWYMFMWDRTRALRKELTQQGVCSTESVALVEQCVRFHIHCAERLVDQDTAIYDDKINTENLTKCLQTLKYMYKDLGKEDIKCPNEPEFVGYSLLLNLNNSSVFIELSDMHDSLMASDAVKFALNIMTSWETKNYIRFFNLVKKTTYLNCCLLRRYFGEMRLYAIKTMIHSYCTKNYSPQIVLSRFVENLNFEGEDECAQFLAQCNFNFRTLDGFNAVNFNRLLFRNPETTLTFGRAYIFIEEKKKSRLSVVMAGGVLPPKLFENYIPENSFTENGELKQDLPLISELMNFSNNSSGIIKKPSSDFKFDSTKPTMNAFQKEEPIEFFGNSNTQEKVQSKTLPFGNSIFGNISEKNSTPSNIFAPVFGQTSNISNIFQKPFQTKSESFFSTTETNEAKKNIFGKESLFDNSKSSIFGSEKKIGDQHLVFSFSNTSEGNNKFSNSLKPFSELSKNSLTFHKSDSQAQFKASTEDKFTEEKEISQKETLENEERIKQLKEEEIRLKKLEEEKKEQILIAEKKLQEEKDKKEKERQEKLKMEQHILLENEKRLRLEEQERQKKLKEAELKKEEERKRELENRKNVENKLAQLRTKIQKWKMKIIFEKWRIKTWNRIEGRKMKVYSNEVKLKYPPVCPNELLNGNPYGLVVPNILTFEKFRNWKRNLSNEIIKTKKLFIISNDLPLIKPDCLLKKSLLDLEKKIVCKLSPFPWKLVISVPDELECPQYWKSIETFVEMHFVKDYNWEFGIRKGPLFCQSGSYGSFKFVISIRRFRGCDLMEGNEPNKTAVEGCNAIIFFLSENGNEKSRERLETILHSKPLHPQVPIIVFSLNDEPAEEVTLIKLLNLEKLKNSYVSEYAFIYGGNEKNLLIEQLIQCLNLSVKMSADPPSLRLGFLSIFLKQNWLEFFWQSMEINISNFKIDLSEPIVLIDFYNSCLEELFIKFISKSKENYSVLAEEFYDFKICRPNVTSIYWENLEKILNILKLPYWPAQTPTSSHQLNYRIHQYCKKIVSQDRIKLKRLKWILYGIIRRSLLWKGFDIYCEEDIDDILINFPWIEVFKEISRFIITQWNKENDVTIFYDESTNIIFSPSFIGEVLSKLKKKSKTKVVATFGESENWNPCLENDSIVYAYSVALKRKSNKRKREEFIDESLDTLFCSPSNKCIALEEMVKMEIKEEEEEEKEKSVIREEVSQMESNFQKLSEQLDAIKKRISENESFLINIQNEFL